jgi:serine protease
MTNGAVGSGIRMPEDHRVIPRSIVRASATLLLSALLVIEGAASAAGAPSSSALYAPIRAFEWPAGAPDDPWFGSQTDLQPIGVPTAWLRTTGSQAVVVAVLDTGIDAAHPEFAGRIVPGYDAIRDRADGPTDFGPTNDDQGHGTHVSGTIAAAANNGGGIAGIAPSVTIMPIKVLDANGEGTFSSMVRGMNWAVAHGARIITMSLGGPLGPDAAGQVQGTVDAAYSAGAVIVAASGNDGAVIDQYPCNFRHVLCVGSATYDGTAVSTFSTRTAALALVAPGEHIASAYPGNQYAYGSGTSMATPHVTGAVALLRSLDPQISVDQVVIDLVETAKPLVPGGRNPDSGYGLLQVGAALDRVGGETPLPALSPGTTPTPTPAPGASPTPVPTPDAVPTPVAAPTPDVPAVIASTPRNGSRNVLRSARPRLTFSVPVTGISARTITMIDLSLGRRVPAGISYSASSLVATITPTTRLAAGHSYRIIVGAITSANGGLPLARTFILTFRTASR